ncbi:hypothetical protein [Photobacterium nomapromontoriensis]|uniref:hypothetical protein n=1 Tax=Photobacterium nomapromontoriensis TaxID=2910237 RepID=UPI003D14449B
MRKSNYDAINDEFNNDVLSTALLCIPLIVISIWGENTSLINMFFLFLIIQVAICIFMSRGKWRFKFQVFYMAYNTLVHVFIYCFIFKYVNLFLLDVRGWPWFVISICIAFVFSFVFEFAVLGRKFENAIECGRVIEGEMLCRVENKYFPNKTLWKPIVYLMLLLLIASFLLSLFATFESHGGVLEYLFIISIWIIFSFHLSVIFYTNLTNWIYTFVAFLKPIITHKDKM